MSGGGLIRALRSLRLIEGDEVKLVRAIPDDRPRGYWGPYPIRSHRTMAQVMADEAAA